MRVLVPNGGLHSVRIRPLLSPSDSAGLTLAIEDGRADWYVDLDEPALFRIEGPRDGYGPTLLIRPLDRIEIHDFGTDSARILGSGESARLLALEGLYRRLGDSCRGWRAALIAGKDEARDSTRAVYAARYEWAVQEIQRATRGFILSAPYSKSAIYALCAETTRGHPVFDLTRDSALFRSVLEKQKGVYRDLEYINPILRATEELEAAREGWRSAHDTATMAREL